jgi:hypothetical protein
LIPCVIFCGGNTNHTALHDAVYFILLLLPRTEAQISSSASDFQTALACVLPSVTERERETKILYSVDRASRYNSC